MEFRHEDRDSVGAAPPLKQPRFGLIHQQLTGPSNATVRLTFKKGEDSESGNGFFVHIPGAKRKFLLTAGHNLLSKKPHTELKIRLFESESETEISADDVRVSSAWRDNPEEHHAAEDDYGVILLPDDFKVPGDFGFSLGLGLEERLDCDLNVTGYRVGTAPDEPPSISTGACVNPIMQKNQLGYLIETEAGLSGSPVWVGYKKYPTVVAIHNYGQKIKKSGHGSKGTRINFKCLRDIFS